MSGRHLIALIALALLPFVFLSCGSDSSPLAPPGEDPPDTSGIVAVTLSTGRWPAADRQGLVPDIPAGVASAVFTVTTADSVYSASATLVAGEPALRVTLDLPVGEMGRFECQAEDDVKAVLYRGVIYRTVPGEADTLFVNMADAADATPPVMGGSVTATVLGATELELTWDPATAGGDPATDAAYLVWLAGGAAPPKADSLPWAAAPAGQTGLFIGGLTPGEHYGVTVKAVDPSGNVSVLSAVTAATLLAVNECYWVDVATGTDSPECGAFDSPCRTITQALANSDGEPIYVEAGTYSEATGETFPLVLKAGTRLAGDIFWPLGRPQTVIEVGTVESAIQVPISGSISGVEIDNSATGATWLIDAREGNVWIDNVVAEVYNSQAGIICGARASIRNTIVRGRYSPRGIGLYGNEYQQVISCIVEDFQSGISMQGRDMWVHGSLVRDCASGIVAWGYDPGETGDIQISRTIVMDCNDGIQVSLADDVLIQGNTIWRNSQRGIMLSHVGSTTRVHSCHIDGGQVGVIVFSGNPVIESNTLVCSGVNLLVRGTDVVQAGQNRWDHHPPVVRTADNDGEFPDSDICYGGTYYGTPLPDWEPSLGRTGCLSIGIVPHVPKQLPGFLKQVEERVAAMRYED